MTVEIQYICKCGSHEEVTITEEDHEAGHKDFVCTHCGFENSVTIQKENDAPPREELH